MILKARQNSGDVYIIHSLDPRFDEFAASYLEARLIDIADELGLPLANQVRPFGRDGLRPCSDLEQLVQHAQFLLPVAGFRRLVDARRTTSGRPLRISATVDLHDVRPVEPDAMTVPPDAAPMRLVSRHLRAEGFAIGGRLLVLPGAEYSYVSGTGLSEDNRSRREAIQRLDIIEPLPGVSDRGRLTVGLDCKSRAMAAKILTGQHVGSEVWQASGT